MPSTPLICCSSGEATVSAMTVGFAPGYVARTTTVGGTTSGYSLRGRRKYASAPMTKMMMDITAAKMGRLMKKLEIFMGGSGLLPHFRFARIAFLTCEGGLRGCVAQRVSLASHGDCLGRDGGSGTHALQAADDDNVALAQAFTHHTQSLRHRAEFHGAIFERVVFTEHKDVLLIQIGDDSLVSRETPTLGAATLQPNPCKKPWGQSQILVRKSGAQANGTCRRADLIVHKAHLAGVGESVFVRQA